MTLRAIKIYLNDEDPLEAAILKAWDECLPRRRSALMRAWLLGNPSKPASTAKPSPLRALPPADDPKPAPVDGKTSLEAAKEKFLNSFG